MTTTNVSVGDQTGVKQKRKFGKSLREKVPFKLHGDRTPGENRPDPVDLLQAQDAGRLQHLLPIKYGRMLASPFAFLRGSAAVMAADLAATPSIGMDVVLCGDAYSGDLRPTILAIVSFVLYNVVILIPLAQKLMKVGHLQEIQDYLLIAAAATIWVFVLRGVWRFRLIQLGTNRLSNLVQGDSNK